jgi:hypothetical protein
MIAVPKIVECLVISFVTLRLVMSASTGQMQLANAGGKSPYESGYEHGCDDADISDPDDRYINQPEKGPSFHTNEFMRGYNDGYDECSGQESQSSDDEASEPQDSGERHYDGWLNWRQVCSDLDDLISEPCSDLVTSDGNALTAEGKETLERIRCGGETLLGVLMSGNLLAALQGLRC